MATQGFYSSVILNGTETWKHEHFVENQFYSSVILNGTETQTSHCKRKPRFYSSAIIITMSFLV